MFNLFNLLDEKPVVYHYRVFLNTGATIDVRDCKELVLDVSNQTGKIKSYEFNFNSDLGGFHYIDPTAIVAITRI